MHETKHLTGCVVKQGQVSKLLLLGTEEELREEKPSHAILILRGQFRNVQRAAS